MVHDGFNPVKISHPSRIGIILAGLDETAG